ncbi:hypothetical protein KCP74_22510 [Salmonella enterica subsp. enterica]|nr:hypothetical protein KCP74_22510 [Salmonella enterica subsp. enterica]
MQQQRGCAAGMTRQALICQCVGRGLRPRTYSGYWRAGSRSDRHGSSLPMYGKARDRQAAHVTLFAWRISKRFPMTPKF